jgi:peptide/nickel transport system substrate-binding protein
MVHDGLVGFRRAAGADNLDPVPNLAETLPEPTEGGRTYTFTLRPGIRYSTGRLVAPEDFRRGLERMFAVSAAAVEANRPATGDPSHFEKIIGAAACLRTATACDLSEGITIGADTVTFRLVEPDPDFLYKLALPFASPVPPGTDASSPVGDPVVGTGPYLVAAFTPDKALRLERNPHFRSWSAAARPPAYPDVLRWRRVPDARLVDEVIRGRADVAEADPAQVRANEAAALRHPQQLHQDRQAFTQWLVMDTSRPPFDQVAARRAVALALDRGRLSEALGYGREQAACGLLPPGFVGYEPYCRLTANPDSSGTWHGPDLPRAKRLVDRSDTQGERVDVYWSTGNRAYASVARSVTQTLRRLGYDARLRSLDGPPSGWGRHG